MKKQQSLSINYQMPIVNYQLILVLFLLLIQSKSFAGDNFKQQSSFKTMSHFIKPFGDTGITGSKIATGASPVLISSQFSFTEGPAVDKSGNVFFTDQPNDKIWKYDTDGKLSVFMEKSGRANGMYFDTKGNLIACADEQNELWKISPSKKISVLLKDFNGQTFNGPNDLWIDSLNGGIYFTDPYYKRNYWKEDHAPVREQKVYYLPKNKKKAVVADAEFTRPNGIIGTPDGKLLYIADIGADKTFKYRINEDGSLGDKQLFANQGSDGMTIDNEGNVYLSGKGVTIYNQQGQRIEHIPIPEDWTGNICFSGKDKNILFITASKSIYTLQMKVKGVQ